MVRVVAIDERHTQAMEYSHFALLEKARGNKYAGALFASMALEEELAAIRNVDARGHLEEPLYSVLHRSAATLALDCKNYNLAKQLALKGLENVEHTEIKQELLDVLEQANK